MVITTNDNNLGNGDETSFITTDACIIKDGDKSTTILTGER